jgi:hypothetical protein
MGETKTYSIYFGEEDEDLQEWVEDMLDKPGVYNQAHLFKMALRHMRKDNTEEMLV